MIDRCTQLLNQVQQKLDLGEFQISNEDTETGIAELKNDGMNTGFDFNRIDNYGEDVCKGLIEDGIAVVQAFYGTDISRIEATTRALHYMMKSSRLPEEWIFVEAQSSKSKCCFSWLNGYGIRHIFVKTTKDQDGIFLKTPLWNIGASKCKSSKLCFIDSDVIFQNPNWLDEASQKLEEYDAISIGGICCYEDGRRNPTNSIGLEFASSNGKILKFPHSGFTIGMTRELFNRIHGFDACVILDDIWNWSRLLGSNVLSILDTWLPCCLPRNEQHGYQLKLGSTKEKCIHLYHGKDNDNKYLSLTNALKYHITSYSEIVEYNKENFEILPKWKDTKLGKIISSTISNINSSKENIDGQIEYFKHAKNVFGEISQDNPLVICTYLKSSFECNKQTIDAMYSAILEKIYNNVTFLVFTNDIKQDDVEYDVIPLSKQFDEDCPWKECFRKDVKFSQKTNILFISPYEKIDNITDFAVCENNDLGVDSKNNVYYFNSDMNLKNYIVVPLEKYVLTTKNT